MPSPTYEASYRPGAMATGTTLTASVTTNPGDVLWLYGAVASNSVTLSTPTGGTNLTWSLLASATGGFNNPNNYLWAATATTSETFTCSVTASSSSTKWIWQLDRFSSAAYVNFAQAEAQNSAPSIPFTTTSANSLVLYWSVDQARVSGSSRTWRTSGNGAVTETYYEQSASPGATVYIGYHADVGAAGSHTFGLSAPSGQYWRGFCVEVRYAAPPLVPFFPMTNLVARRRSCNW